MMLGECYKNCMFYYQVMQDFLNGKITALELQKKYWHQRDIDLDKNKKSGRYEAYAREIENYKGNQKIFYDEYKMILYGKSMVTKLFSSTKGI